MNMIAFDGSESGKPGGPGDPCGPGERLAIWLITKVARAVCRAPRKS